MEERQQLLAAELRGLTDAELPANFEALPRYKALTERLTERTLVTPRDIKRVVGAFHVMRGAVRKEVDWIDLLGFVVVTTKCPRTVELIRDDPERYVDNPLSTTEQIRRMGRGDGRDQDARFEGLIEKSEDTPEFRWLMSHLFPHLGAGRSSRDEYPDPIAHRRSLLTVLRLGLIPGAASRDLVEDVLSRTSEGVSEAFAEASAQDQVGSLIDRLDDLYSEREHIHHVYFWRGVADFLRRSKHSDTSDIGPTRSIAENVADVLPRAAKRNPKLVAAARDVFHDLAERDDLTLVPNWLREQMYVHGLFDLRMREGETWYNADETVWWANRLSARWKQFFLEEDIFKRVWDLHFAYAMVQSKNWDNICHSRFTRLLDDNETFDNVIVMMFGGIYATGRSTIKLLCDGERFDDRAEERSRSDDLRTKPEVRQALAKYKSRDFD